MSKFRLICLILATSPMLTSCYTVEGFGKDMQKGGQELQQSANQHQSRTY